MPVLLTYLNRQVILGSVAFACVLLLLSLVSLLSQYLRAAAAGEVLPSLIPALIALSLPHNLSLIWPLSFFAALVVSLGRMSAAHELDVLNACGMDTRKLLLWLSPSLLLASLIMGGLSLYLVPKSMLQFERLHNERDGRDWLEQLVVGKPMRISSSNMIFSAAKTPESELERVLVISRVGADGWQLVLAPRGDRHWDEQHLARYLHFQDANFYQIDPKQLLEFNKASHAYWALPEQLKQFKLDRPEAIATTDLLSTPTAEAQAQLQWRLSSIVSVALLFLLAVNIGKLPPRSGRFSGLPKALGIYLAYTLGLYACYQAVADGQIALWPGMLWVHAAALLSYAALQWRSHRA